MTPQVRIAALLAFASAFGTSAHADVDVEISNGATVRGTLSAGEVETLRARLPAGALLSVVVAGKKTKGVPAPAVTFEVRDDADAPVPGATAAPKGNGARIKKAAVPRSEVYQIRVSGVGGATGAYQAKVSWKALTKGGGEVTLGAGDVSVPFATEAGSVVSFSVKAAKGSAALPRLLTVEHATEGVVHTFTQPDAAAKKHVAKKVPFADAGDNDLAVGDVGGGGTAIVKLKIKAPKTKKATVDLTDAAIGETGNSGVARGVVVGPGGGALVLDPTTGLEGVGVDVPAGALTRPTAVVIATGEQVDPGDGQEGVGPPIAFGPDGLRFQSAVEITLPYDPDRVDGDPANVSVAVRDARGNVSLVPATDIDVDPVAGIVTVMVEHFSTYQVVANRKPPVHADLNGDGWADVVVSTSGNFTDNNDAVHVWFGGPGLASGDTATADVVFTPEGGVDNQRFGSSIATGDLNGDGVEDLAISAWQANLQGAPLDVNGRIYVFFGGAGFTGSSDVANDADAVIAGVGGERLGKAIAIGDVTGDSTPDLVATTEGKLNGNIHSRVYAFAGGPGFAPDDTNDARLSFEAPDTIGLAQIIAIGDMLGDDKADIAVGSPFRNGGEVHVFAGRAGAFSGGFTAAAVVLTAAGGVTEFGREVGAGDLDDDGRAELVVSGIANPATVFVFKGGATLASGNSGSATYTFTEGGTLSSDRFGQTFAVGDVTGDGVPELLIGDELGGFDDGGQFVTEEGAVFGFAGGSGFASGTAALPGLLRRGIRAADFFGEYVFVADVTGDGIGDLLAGVHRADDNGSNSGSLYVLAGNPNFQAIPAPADATITLTGAAAGDEFTSQERF